MTFESHDELLAAPSTRYRLPDWSAADLLQAYSGQELLGMSFGEPNSH
jgi:hypothetical protein